MTNETDSVVRAAQVQQKLRKLSAELEKFADEMQTQVDKLRHVLDLEESEGHP